MTGYQNNHRHAYFICTILAFTLGYVAHGFELLHENWLSFLCVAPVVLCIAVLDVSYRRILKDTEAEARASYERAQAAEVELARLERAARSTITWRDGKIHVEYDDE